MTLKKVTLPVFVIDPEVILIGPLMTWVSLGNIGGLLWPLVQFLQSMLSHQFVTRHQAPVRDQVQVWKIQGCRWNIKSSFKCTSLRPPDGRRLTLFFPTFSVVIFYSYSISLHEMLNKNLGEGIIVS